MHSIAGTQNRGAGCFGRMWSHVRDLCQCGRIQGNVSRQPTQTGDLGIIGTNQGNARIANTHGKWKGLRHSPEYCDCSRNATHPNTVENWLPTTLFAIAADDNKNDDDRRVDDVDWHSYTQRSGCWELVQECGISNFYIVIVSNKLRAAIP